MEDFYHRLNTRSLRILFGPDNTPTQVGVYYLDSEQEISQTSHGITEFNQLAYPVPTASKRANYYQTF